LAENERQERGKKSGGRLIAPVNHESLSGRGPLPEVIEGEEKSVSERKTSEQISRKGAQKWRGAQELEREESAS